MIPYFPEGAMPWSLRTVLLRYHIRCNLDEEEWGSWRDEVHPISALGVRKRIESAFGVTLDKGFERRHSFENYLGAFVPFGFPSMDVRDKPRKIWGNFRADDFMAAGPRYCSVCAARDRERVGYGHWYRVHQINHLRHCPEHMCLLKNICLNCGRALSFLYKNYLPEDRCPHCSRNEFGSSLSDATTSIYYSVLEVAASTCAGGDNWLQPGRIDGLLAYLVGFAPSRGDVSFARKDFFEFWGVANEDDLGEKIGIQVEPDTLKAFFGRKLYLMPRALIITLVIYLRSRIPIGDQEHLLNLPDAQIWGDLGIALAKGEFSRPAYQIFDIYKNVMSCGLPIRIAQLVSQDKQDLGVHVSNPEERRAIIGYRKFISFYQLAELSRTEAAALTRSLKRE